MCDPKVPNIEAETLNALTLSQLKELQRNLGNRIERKLVEDNLDAKFAMKVAQELTADGPLHVTAALETKFELMPGYRVSAIKRKRPEDHPNVQAFIAKVRKDIAEKLTDSRLEDAGLPIESRSTIENLILGYL